MARIVKDFCTPLSSGPVPDPDLLAHFRNVTEILNTDAAADERKCARLLSSGKHAFFPNCKATVRPLSQNNMLVQLFVYSLAIGDMIDVIPTTFHH